MANDGPTIALYADPDDPEDGDVTVEAVERALAEREERLRRATRLLSAADRNSDPR